MAATGTPVRYLRPFVYNVTITHEDASKTQYYLAVDGPVNNPALIGYVDADLAADLVASGLATIIE